MVDNTNDNQDLDDTEETTEGEEDTSSTDGEESEEESTDEGGEDESEEEAEGEDESDDEDEADDEAGDGEFVMPEKFKGKDATAIAKSYTELEKRIQTEAQKIAKELMGKAPKKPTKEQEDALMAELKGVDFAKMKPEQFAEFILKMAKKQAETLARTTYESAEVTRTRVNADIATTAKTWPQLKDNEGFRDMVLALIENAASKGEILPLKDACAKVGKSLGIKPGAKKPADGEGDGKGEKGKDGKRKLGVERQGGSGGGDKQTDDEKVIAGIIGAGQTGNKLGGLGV